MLGKILVSLSLTLVSSALLGCSSDEPSSACTVTLPTDTVSADGHVTYSASVVGTGSIDSVEYAADSKLVTVKGPTLPFMVTIDVKANDPISIKAVGSAANGDKVVASYAFVDAAGGDPIVTDAECSH
ncbi:MAG TPA: hypothetical protein VER11_05335 [Polyangiaceae bacterium]|nr:hypothetical protein [Polyangiaceae bacterium]